MNTATSVARLGRLRDVRRDMNSVRKISSPSYSDTGGGYDEQINRTNMRDVIA